MENHEEVWREASNTLRGMLNADLFTRWFAPVKALEIADETLVLGVANEFYQIWLQDNFLPLIREAVRQVSDRDLQVRFVIHQETRVQEPDPPTKSRPPTSKRSRRQSSASLAADITLNPRYTFDSFVVGPNNNFAHAAALAVAQSPAKAYNPLFLYGGTGLGKTHLMQAIGHHVLLNQRNGKIAYVSCEQFTNDFIQAIQTSSITKFRKKYRHADVLLIDDIQFLSGKERMQEEFFHTFNTLFDAHRQIVLSSDRPAAEIANLETRLVSRFEWGLVTEVQPPDFETRIAILQKKAGALKLALPDHVIQFIAQKIRTNIRRLESALVRVASYSSLTGKEISIEMLETLLRDALHEEARQSVSIDMIQKKVASHFDIRLADMTSRRRPQNIAFPRQVAMYLSRTLTDRSLADIGDSFGGRDHGTVLHACRLIEEKMRADQTLRQTVSYLAKSLER